MKPSVRWQSEQRARGPILHDEAGVALILTLIIITLVAVVVLELNYLMRVEVHASANFRDGVRSYYIAKSGVTVVKALFSRNIQELEDLKAALLAGGSHTLPLQEGSVTIRVIDEAGKINVNTLLAEGQTPQQPQAQRRGRQPAELRTWMDVTRDLFQRLGIDPHLVDAIVDWIDADDIPAGPGGAESQYYRALDKPYVARNGPMETIAELRLLKGFSEEVLLKLGAKRVGGIVDPTTNAYLTALSVPQEGAWRVNLNTAPPLLLASLTREVGQFAEAVVQRRKEGRIEKITELQELGITGQALQDFQRFATLTSLYYSVETQGTVGEIVKQITALMKIGGDGGSQILYWRVQ